MKGKKLISSIMAVAMTASAMSVMVSANTYEVNASYSAPEVNAIVPSALEVFINPYHASITTKSTDTALAGTSTFSAGLVSPNYKIDNNDTNFGLNVTATTLVGKASKGIEVSDTPIDEASTDKLAFAYLNTTKLVDNTTPVFMNTTYNEKDASQLAFTSESVKAMGILNLDKKGTGLVSTGYFRVEGQVSENPETPWGETDSIALSLILDLAPSSGVERDCSLTSIISAGTTDLLATDATLTDFDVKVADLTATDMKIVVKDYEDKDGDSKVDAKVYVLKNDTNLTTTALEPDDGDGSVGLGGNGEPLKTWTPAAGDKIQFVVTINGYSKTYTINVIS